MLHCWEQVWSRVLRPPSLDKAYERRVGGRPNFHEDRPNPCLQYNSIRLGLHSPEMGKHRRGPDRGMSSEREFSFRCEDAYAAGVFQIGGRWNERAFGEVDFLSESCIARSERPCAS